MKIYAKFNTEGICKGLIRTNDETMIIPQDFEEIDADSDIKVNYYKRVSGKIQKLSEAEILEIERDIESVKV